jgi:cytochrome c-type biogenesis protein CcmH
MTGFWTAALILGLIAAAFVLVPVVRSWSKDKGRSTSTLAVGLVAALAIPVAAPALYWNWSNWDWTGAADVTAEAAAMHELEGAIAALEARLAREPGDVQGWIMLGRSNMAIRRFDGAARAYRGALQAQGGEPPDLMADLGEALALSDPNGVQGEAAPLFERVLELAPDHPKALWYGGLYAFETSDFATAENRLSRLLTMNPPQELVPLIQERIEQSRAHAGLPPEALADRAAESPAVASGGAPERAAAAPEPAAPPADGEAAAEGAIQLEVSLDPALASRLAGPVPLFIIARTAAGGPPLAVIRRSSDELPLAVSLTDANTMVEGTSLADHDEIVLVARLSLSGTPAQRAGDLYGELSYARGNGPVRIRIDQVAQ